MNATRAIERKHLSLFLAAVVIIAAFVITVLHIHAARSSSPQPIQRRAAKTLSAASNPDTQRGAETVSTVKRGAPLRADSSATAPTKSRSAITQTDMQGPQEKLKERIQKGFDDIVHDDSQHVFQSPAVSAQAAFDKEPVDADWAPTATQEIQDRLATEFGDRFDISTVACRTDICQIEASARANGDALSDAMDFQNTWISPDGQAWLGLQGFDDQITTGGTVDGVPIFVVFLSRK